MRQLQFALCFFAFTLAQVDPIPASEPQDPLRLIDKALEAGGGIEKISKFKAVSMQAKGKIYGFECAINGSFQGLEQVRLEVSTKDTVTTIYNRDKFWVKQGNEPVQDLSNTDGTSIKHFFHALCLPDLLITLKGKDYKLARLDENQGNEKNAVGISVTHKNFKEVRLFFDKTSGLPIKSEVKLIGLNGEDWADLYFSDFKVIQGVKHFMRFNMRQGNQDVYEFEIKELKLLEQLDEKTFAKPE